MAEGLEEIDLRRDGFRDDLFELFKLQLKKDFESCGMEGGFAEHLPSVYENLHAAILKELKGVMKSESGLMALLYRIDISEPMIRKSRNEHPDADFDILLTELIIKRILQKVILKKHFSS